MSTPTPSEALKGSFADIDFGKVYAGLAAKGIAVTDELKADIESITRDELKKFEGGKLIGTDWGASLLGPGSLLYTFWAAVQKIFGNMGNVDGAGGLASLISNGSAQAAEQTKLHQLDLATDHIYQRLADKGYADIGELISGKVVNKPRAEDMQGSVYNQVLATLDRTKLPADLSTSLDSKRMDATEYASAENGVSHGLPADTTKRLTPPNASL